MDYIIRAIKETEYPLLEDFLYEAIFVPEGAEAPPRSILETPELQASIAGFGKQEHDKALVVELDNKIVGAVWARIAKDYGHIDDKTPSLDISLYKEYRGLGIGTEMMKSMISLLKDCGYEQVSLSVQKANYAVKIYERVGFEVFLDKEGEYIMIKRLQR